MDRMELKVELDGGRYSVSAAYLPRGEDLVVFLHGLGCSQESFREAWLRRELAGFSLLSFDFLGFGRSDRPGTFSYAIEDHARVAAEVLAAFPSPTRLHLVGHSMGGAVALLLPERTLSSLSSFANLEGNLVGEDCGILSRELAGSTLEELRRSKLDRLRRRLDESRFSFDQSDLVALHRSARSLVEWSDAGDLLPRFRGLASPKAYFYGAAGGEPAVLRRLDGIRRIPIPASGHFLMNDNPDAFYPSLLTFIQAR